MNMESRTVEIGQIYRIKADERNSNIVKLLKMSPMETYVRLRAYGLL